MSIKAQLSVYPTGLGLTIFEGTPPFKVYLGDILLAQTDRDFVFIPFDTTRNIRNLELTIVDSAQFVYKVYPGPGVSDFNPYELGFLKVIAAKLNVKLKYRGGFKVLVRKRRNWGEPCPVCRDKVGPPKELLEGIIEPDYEYQNLSVDANCPVCFGTGYKGGYFEPVEAYAVYFNRTPVVMDTQEPVRFQQTQLIVSASPILEKDDLLIIPSLGNLIFRVIQVKPNEYKGVVVNQNVVVESIPEGSALSRLVNLQTLEFQDNAYGGFGLVDEGATAG
jgi:hypothetical protein